MTRRSWLILASMLVVTTPGYAVVLMYWAPLLLALDPGSRARPMAEGSFTFVVILVSSLIAVLVFETLRYHSAEPKPSRLVGFLLAFAPYGVWVASTQIIIHTRNLHLSS